MMANSTQFHSRVGVIALPGNWPRITAASLSPVSRMVNGIAIRGPSLICRFLPNRPKSGAIMLLGVGITMDEKHDDVHMRISLANGRF